jgi:peroxiredoxin Q/BCP
VEEEPAEPPPVAHEPIAAPQPRDGVIPVGETAPDFEGMDQKGRWVRLYTLLRTKDVVLVFYPADFTPGCTKQLCSVRDDWSEFGKRNAVVLGITPANVSRHAEFAGKYHFPFPVLSDPMGRITAGYGAAGSNPETPLRTVYVIHRDRRVALSKRGMVPHDEIFAALDRP